MHEEGLKKNANLDHNIYNTHAQAKTKKKKRKKKTNETEPSIKPMPCCVAKACAFSFGTFLIFSRSHLLPTRMVGI